MDASSEIVPFSNESFGTVRAIIEDGEPIFVASDIAKALGYRDAEKMARRLDDDEKGTRSVGTLGGDQNMTVITEAGLYSAILGSQVPNAKAFKRWVTHEVIPSIRRRGVYATAETAERLMADPDFMIRTFTELKSARSRAERAERRVKRMRPKALVGEAVEPSAALYTLTQATKLVQNVNRSVRRRDVIALLRETGMIYQNSTEPTHKAIETGRLAAAVAPPIRHRDGTVTGQRPYAKVTGKGLGWLVSRFAPVTGEVAF